MSAVNSTSLPCYLTSMQEGMLFHHLQAEGSGVDHEQLVCSFHHPIDVEALKDSWQKLAERHAVMRTSFQWENCLRPVQIVHDQVRLPFEVIDLRKVSAPDQERELHRYLEQDRGAGFEWERAPLMRFALFHLADNDHRLVWSFHHAILDGRSFPIVLNEACQIYDAMLQDQQVDLQPLRQYSDFVRWLEEQDLSKAESYWRKTLQDFTAPTSLSALEKGSGESGHGEEEIRLAKQVTESLRALATREGLSLNTIVQGAWALVLSRYSGAKDVVFGATRACRGFSSDAPAMVGTFINTLPVRVAISDEMPLIAWLRQIRTDQRAIREYEHTPLAMIQSWSEIPRGTQLFESILVFENYLLDSKMRSDSAHWNNREVYLLERTNYALTLYGYAEPELILKLAYHKARFSHVSISRLLGHLHVLLEAMAARPDARLSDLPILTPSEERLILHEWNNTAVDYRREKRIHDFIEEQAQRTPEDVAMVFRDQQITYGELDRKADQLARYLVHLGIGAGDRVGIFMRRSLEMMVGLLAVLKAGAAYVPLDPSYPAERLKNVLQDAQPAAILTQERLQDSLPVYAVRVVAVDSDWPSIDCFKNEPRLADFSSDHIAYVIYTSGSTGQPKGVMVSHRNVANFFASMDRKLGRDKPGVWLAVTSISFDISVLELFWTLSRGFKVVLQEEGYDLPGSALSPASRTRSIDFSLFYFASEDSQARDKYRLLIEGARFADQAGFKAIWTPERHFHPFGGLFPNPSIAGAALAMITKHLRIRAGSVVLPLHNPIRVAEEWSVVDNLSQGRVDLSFASGWHDRDFVFAPQHYADRKKVMIRDIDAVRSLARRVDRAAKWFGKGCERRHFSTTAPARTAGLDYRRR